jgi:hypothetical protein
METPQYETNIAKDMLPAGNYFTILIQGLRHDGKQYIAQISVRYLLFTV